MLLSINIQVLLFSLAFLNLKAAGGMNDNVSYTLLAGEVSMKFEE